MRHLRQITPQQEMVEFSSGFRAMCLDLEVHRVGAAKLNNYPFLKKGNTVAEGASQVVHVPVGPEFIGRLVPVIWNQIDAEGSIDALERPRTSIDITVFCLSASLW